VFGVGGGGVAQKKKYQIDRTRTLFRTKGRSFRADESKNAHKEGQLGSCVEIRFVGRGEFKTSYLTKRSATRPAKQTGVHLRGSVMEQGAEVMGNPPDERG